MRPALFPLLLAAACGMTTDKFDDRYELKFCAEYEACFDDFDCDDRTQTDIVDNSSCDFDPESAKACLEGDWQCITNEGQPFVSIPGACATVYTNCNTPTGTGTPVGTPTGTASR